MVVNTSGTSGQSSDDIGSIADVIMITLPADSPRANPIEGAYQVHRPRLG